MSDSEFPSLTSNSPSECFSLYGDVSYGEPLVAQHLVINFTPLPDVDNDYVQRKCCAFWDFINSRPELQNLIVLPESNVYRTNFESSDSAPKVESLKTAEPIADALTAVSMLETVEEKGLINCTFETKMAQSNCSLGSREYHEDENLTRKPSLRDKACICSGVCVPVCLRRPSAASLDVVDLCQKMELWDSEHPKSMDPPGHPPAHSQSILQKKML